MIGYVNVDLSNKLYKSDDRPRDGFVSIFYNPEKNQILIRSKDEDISMLNGDIYNFEERYIFIDLSERDTYTTVNPTLIKSGDLCITEDTLELYRWSEENSIWNLMNSVLRGEQGLQGIRGDVGVQGDVGYQGPRGQDGDHGDRGLTGDQGDQGVQGIPGLDGSKGFVGEQGSRGIQGEQGNPTESINDEIADINHTYSSTKIESIIEFFEDTIQSLPLHATTNQYITLIRSAINLEHTHKFHIMEDKKLHVSILDNSRVWHDLGSFQDKVDSIYHDMINNNIFLRKDSVDEDTLGDIKITGSDSKVTLNEYDGHAWYKSFTLSPEVTTSKYYLDSESGTSGIIGISTKEQHGSFNIFKPTTSSGGFEYGSLSKKLTLSCNAAKYFRISLPSYEYEYSSQETGDDLHSDTIFSFFDTFNSNEDNTAFQFNKFSLESNIDFKFRFIIEELVENRLIYESVTDFEFRTGNGSQGIVGYNVYDTTSSVFLIDGFNYKITIFTDQLVIIKGKKISETDFTPNITLNGIVTKTVSTELTPTWEQGVYIKGDFVIYDGKTYICLTESTQSGTFESNVQHWNTMKNILLFTDEHRSVKTGNPHNVTKSDLGLDNVENKTADDILGEILDADIPISISRTSDMVSEIEVSKNSILDSVPYDGNTLKKLYTRILALENT